MKTIGVFSFLLAYFGGLQFELLCLADFLEDTFVRRPDMANRTSTTEQVLVVLDSPFMDCIVLCAQHKLCLSIFYDNVEQDCTGHSSLFTGPSTPGVSPVTSAVHWEVKDPYEKIKCVPMASEPGYCIKLHYTLLSWTDQIQACQSENTSLASLVTLDRFLFTRNYLLNSGYSGAVTVGASDQTGQWLWESGDTLSVLSSLWGPSEPSGETGQDCGILAHGISFYMNDGYCDTTKAFLCDKIIYKS